MTGSHSISATLKLAPQPRRILAHLLKGNHITNNESFITYGIYRLSDCIRKIRIAGYDVRTDVKLDPVGRKYASYSLQTQYAH
jgi:hypothetical protein